MLDLSSLPALEVPLEGNCSDALRLSFDSNNEFLACADKSEIIVWFTKNRSKDSTIKLPRGYTIRDVAVSLEGRYIAATSVNGEARLWDTSNHDQTGTVFPFDDAQSVSFSPGKKLLSIGGQSEIKLWNIQLKKFNYQRIPIGGFAMKFSPDSSLIATQTTHYGDVSVWNVRNPLLGGTVSSTLGAINDFSFASDNGLLTASDSGIFVEPYDASWALGHVCHIVNRNLTPVEWNKYLPGFDYKSTCSS